MIPGRLRLLVLCICLSLAILVTLQLLVDLSTAQEPAGELAERPAGVGPPRMRLQPPDDADQLSDFLPPGMVYEQQRPSVGQSVSNSLPKTLDRAFSYDLGWADLALVVEQDTFTQELNIAFRPQAVAEVIRDKKAAGAYRDNQQLIRFQIEALTVKDARPLDSFAGPVRLVVDLRQFGFDEAVAGRFYLAYEDEDEPGVWHDVPLTVHQTDGLISAEVSHFSDWMTGWKPEQWAPQWTLPTASTFSGAAVYQYAFKVPEGRHGLQPNVSLSYSSRALDGAIRKVPTGAVASGWALDEISIVRTGIRLNSSGTGLTFPDTYRLVLHGSGHELTEGATVSNRTRWYAKDMPQLRIYSYDSREDPDDGEGFWVVQSGDGTSYRLGYADDSKSIQKTWLNKAPENEPDQHKPIAWHVDTVTDNFGNQIVYVNDNDVRTNYENLGYWCPWGGNCYLHIYTAEVRVQKIKYNFPEAVSAPWPAKSVTRLISTPASKIEFDYDSAAHLEYIDIYHGGSLVRTYWLETEALIYNAASQGCEKGAQERTTETRIVSAISEYGYTKNITGTVFTSTLPSTTFTYTARHHYKESESPLQYCFYYYYLKEVDNGYGGLTTFNYQSDGRSKGTYNYTNDATITYPTIGYNNWVKKIAYDSDGDGQDAYESVYAFSDRCYNQTSTDESCCPSADAPEYGNIAGFGELVLTVKEPDGSESSRTITENSQDVDDAFGRPLSQQAGEPDPDSNELDVLLSETLYEYDQLSFGANDEGEFSYLKEQTSRSYDATSDVISNTVSYSYDESFQGGDQYGNVTHVYQKGAETTTQLTTRSWYSPTVAGDSGRWLVNYPLGSAIYQGSGWTDLQTTWNYYDGATSHTTAPTSGALTRTRLMRKISCSDENLSDTSGCAHAYETIDKTLTYDDFGNVSKETTYSDYGYQTLISVRRLPAPSSARLHLARCICIAQLWSKMNSGYIVP